MWPLETCWIQYFLVIDQDCLIFVMEKSPAPRTDVLISKRVRLKLGHCHLHRSNSGALLDNYGLLTWTRVTKSLWTHNWNLVKINFCFDHDSANWVRSQICICHDSWAVMTCAKLWPDLSISYSSTPFFKRFGLWAHKTLVKWGPCIFIFVIGPPKFHYLKWSFFIPFRY